MNKRDYVEYKSNELNEIELAYFVGGWVDARGCKVERLCALEYGVDIIDDKKFI